MQVTFHGAAGEVTGSSHLVTANGRKILLDCGTVQGDDAAERRNAEPFAFDPATLDASILSHAHIDHIGRVPLLVARGYAGPIYAQAATADLARIMLEDAAHIAESDTDRDNRDRRRRGEAPLAPLFTRQDVEHALQRMRPLPYDVPETLFPGIELTLRDAGHILGSSVIELLATENGVARRLVFSGDLGPKGTPILRDPAPIAQADLVLMESTYGNRLHRSRAETMTEFGKILDAARVGGGNVVIPAFAVGRTQELLYAFAMHYEEWQLDRFKIFLDSPMAGKVVEAYERHEDLFDDEARALWTRRPHPLRLPNLRFTESAAESQTINALHGGAIIIAGSGMANAGRIRHHLRQNLPRPNAHVVFVGYQAEGTLGRQIVNGAAQVRLFGESVPVRAQRHTIGGLSAHADQAGLVAWYGAIHGNAAAPHPPVFLVHGEDEARVPLARKLHAQFGAKAQLAKPGLIAAV